MFAAILKQVVAKSVAGAKAIELCELGDKLLAEETAKVFKKEKEMKKGKFDQMLCRLHYSSFNNHEFLGIE